MVTMVKRNCCLNLLIFILYLQCSLVQGQGNTVCPCTSINNGSCLEENQVLPADKCKIYTKACGRSGINLFEVVQMVHLKSENSSNCFNETSSSTIMRYVLLYNTSQVMFCDSEVILHFCGMLNEWLHLSCQSSNKPVNQCNLLQGHIVVSVLRQIEWKEIVFLHDNTSDYIVSSSVEEITKYGVFVTTYNIDYYNETELLKIIKTLHEDAIDKTVNITMICHTEQCLSVLESSFVLQDIYIQDQMRIQHISKWIIFTFSNFDQEELNSIKLDNVLFMNIGANRKDARQVYRGRYIHSFTLQTLMWRSKGRSWSPVGEVTSTRDITLNKIIYPNTDFGLNQRMIRVTTLQWKICTTISSDGNYTGLCFKILNEIARRLNFTYEVLIPPDGAFGAELPNGTWSGMVGMIQSGKADLVASALTVNSERERVIDFTYPLVFDHAAVVFAKQKENKWGILLDPYSDIVLASIGICMIIVAVIFFVLERCHPTYRFETTKSPPSFQDSCWYIYGATFAQGGINLPTTVSGRTIISSWWIFCIISIAVYSGNLTATLTAGKHKQLPFTSIAEMVKQTEYKWGTLGNSVFETVFKDSNVPSYAAIWEGIVNFNKTDPSVLSISNSDHFTKVREEKYAFIMSRTIIDLETNASCDFIILDEVVTSDSVAFAMSNKSPFVKIVSDAILSLHENGFIEKWKRDFWPKKICDQSQTYLVNGIYIEDIQSSFYLSAIGILLACILLIFEKVLWLYKLRRRYCRDQSENEP